MAGGPPSHDRCQSCNVSSRLCRWRTTVPHASPSPDRTGALARNIPTGQPGWRDSVSIVEQSTGPRAVGLRNGDRTGVWAVLCTYTHTRGWSSGDANTWELWSKSHVEWAFRTREVLRGAIVSSNRQYLEYFASSSSAQSWRSLADSWTSSASIGSGSSEYCSDSVGPACFWARTLNRARSGPL